MRPCQAHQARLDGPAFWEPLGDDDGPTLTVCWRRAEMVSAIVVRGNHGNVPALRIDLATSCAPGSGEPVFEELDPEGGVMQTLSPPCAFPFSSACGEAITTPAGNSARRFRLASPLKAFAIRIFPERCDGAPPINLQCEVYGRGDSTFQGWIRGLPCWPCVCSALTDWAHSVDRGVHSAIWSPRLNHTLQRVQSCSSRPTSTQHLV